MTADCIRFGVADAALLTASCAFCAPLDAPGDAELAPPLAGPADLTAPPLADDTDLIAPPLADDADLIIPPLADDTALFFYANFSLRERCERPVLQDYPVKGWR